MNTTQREPRLFHLIRHRDVSGVSGTGAVAEGVEWSDGGVALRWRGSHPATSIWETVDAMLAVHGHDGASVIRWLTPPVPPPPVVARYPPATGLRVPTAGVDGRCADCGRAWPCLVCPGVPGPPV